MRAGALPSGSEIVAPDQTSNSRIAVTYEKPAPVRTGRAWFRLSQSPEVFKCVYQYPFAITSRWRHEYQAYDLRLGY